MTGETLFRRTKNEHFKGHRKTEIQWVLGNHDGCFCLATGQRQRRRADCDDALPQCIMDMTV